VLTKSGVSDLNIVEDELLARSPVWPGVDQRIVLVDVEELNKAQLISKDNQLVLTPLSDFTILLLTIAVTLYLPDQDLAR